MTKKFIVSSVRPYGKTQMNILDNLIVTLEKTGLWTGFNLGKRLFQKGDFVRDTKASTEVAW